MAVTTINIDSQVLTFADLASFPVTGTVKTIYIAEDTNYQYYWDGSQYVLLTTEIDIPANLTFYATTAASGIAGYEKLVISIDDPDYDNPAVDVSTGAITGTGQLIAELASDAGIFAGNPGVITISTIGEIRRTAGSGGAEFYFEVYQRDSGGTETLVGTSNKTTTVTSNVYQQFQVSALFNNGTWLTTDRVVIKYYADKVGGGSDPTYDFSFGGTNPVRTLFPISAQLLLNVPIAIGITGVTGGVTNEVLLTDGSGKLGQSELKTVGGNSLFGTGDIPVGGGITIGTTAIASGTVNRILFEGAGNVVQQDSTFVWNNTDKRLILGTEAVANTNSRLVVIGKGTSTNTTFAVHNSTGTNNALVIRDDGFIGGGVSSPTFSDNFEFRKDQNAATLFAINNQTNGATAGSFIVTRTPTASGSISTFPSNNNQGLDGLITKANVTEIVGTGNAPIAFRNIGVTSGTSYVWTGRILGSDFRTMQLENFGLLVIRPPQPNTGLSGIRLGSIGTTLINLNGLNNMLVIDNRQSAGSPPSSIIDANVIYSQDRIAGQSGLVIMSETGTKHIFSNIVGINTVTPNESAVLDVTSTTRGFLPPRNADPATNIATPATGLIVYNTTTNTLDIKSSAASVFNRFGSETLIVGGGNTQATIALSVQNNSTNNNSFIVSDLGNIGIGTTSAGTSATKTLVINNGIAPTGDVTDSFQQYSADIVAGNAAPHFRTENGNVIKIYQETTGIAAAAFVANTSLIFDDSATYGGYTMGQVVAALKAQGLLA